MSIKSLHLFIFPGVAQGSTSILFTLHIKQINGGLGRQGPGRGGRKKILFLGQVLAFKPQYEPGAGLTHLAALNAGPHGAPASTAAAGPPCRARGPPPSPPPPPPPPNRWAPHTHPPPPSGAMGRPPKARWTLRPIPPRARPGTAAVATRPFCSTRAGRPGPCRPPGPPRPSEAGREPVGPRGTRSFRPVGRRGLPESGTCPPDPSRAAPGGPSLPRPEGTAPLSGTWQRLSCSARLRSSSSSSATRGAAAAASARPEAIAGAVVVRASRPLCGVGGGGWGGKRRRSAPGGEGAERACPPAPEGKGRETVP